MHCVCLTSDQTQASKESCFASCNKYKEEVAYGERCWCGPLLVHVIVRVAQLNRHHYAPDAPLLHRQDGLLKGRDHFIVADREAKEILVLRKGASLCLHQMYLFRQGAYLASCEK